jgi:hypothetical protein
MNECAGQARGLKLCVAPPARVCVYSVSQTSAQFLNDVVALFPQSWRPLHPETLSVCSGITTGSGNTIRPCGSHVTCMCRTCMLLLQPPACLQVAAGGDPLGTLDFYAVHGYAIWDENERDSMINMFIHPKSHWGTDKPILVGEHWEQVRHLVYDAAAWLETLCLQCSVALHHCLCHKVCWLAVSRTVCATS